MKAETWINALRNEGHAPRAYSGRGMFGKQCVAITVADWALAAMDLSDSSLPKGGKTLLRDARTDSMGKQTVVYWPDMEWPEDKAAEEAASK